MIPTSFVNVCKWWTPSYWTGKELVHTHTCTHTKPALFTGQNKMLTTAPLKRKLKPTTEVCVFVWITTTAGQTQELTETSKWNICSVYKLLPLKEKLSDGWQHGRNRHREKTRRKPRRKTRRCECWGEILTWKKPSTKFLLLIISIFQKHNCKHLISSHLKLEAQRYGTLKWQVFVIKLLSGQRKTQGDSGTADVTFSCSHCTFKTDL